MVIHLSTKVLHSNTLGLSPQSKNHRAIVCLSLLHVTLFNKQKVHLTFMYMWCTKSKLREKIIKAPPSSGKSPKNGNIAPSKVVMAMYMMRVRKRSSILRFNHSPVPAASSTSSLAAFPLAWRLLTLESVESRN
jgi:hypothetical protein